MLSEKMILEIEVRAKEVLSEFEKLDKQFQETAGENKRLYQLLWKEQNEYVKKAAAENKQRAADEKWLTGQIEKEEQARIRGIRKEAKEEQWLANELKKEVRQRARDEQWLSRELEKEDDKRKRAILKEAKDERWLTNEIKKEQEKREREAERANQKQSRSGGFGGGGKGGGGFGDTVMGAMGVVYSAQELGRLADMAFRAGDRLEGVHRGLETVYGSAERAAERFAELNELAKLPGLDPQPLARYDAIFKNLGATAEQNNILFTGTAKAITTFGGDVYGVNSALLQLSQGFGKNKIDMQDWKSINEQTGGTVIKVAEEVLGFTGGIEGMRKAFKASGTTLQDFLMPVFVELNNRFKGAPVDSYTNRIDNLNVAWNNYIGTITRGNTAVSGFLGMLTGFLEGEAEVWRNAGSLGEPIKAVGDTAKVSAAEIVVLQKDLWRINTTLDTAKEKFQEYTKQGVNENTASMQQLNRRIESLTETKKKLTERLGTAKDAMQTLLKPTETINTEFRVLKEEIEQVDVRFLTFRERGAALKDAIAELPPELTGLSDGFGWLEQKASAIPPIFEDIQKTAEKGLFDVVQWDIEKTNDALEDLIQKAIETDRTFTDISGKTRTPGDFTQSDAYRYGAVDLPGNVDISGISTPTSPFSGRSGGSLADLEIVPKLREFEEKVDISGEVLDAFNAQTKYTAEELEEIRRNELSDFGGSLATAVGVIDNLTPILEDVGLDMSSQRSHGRLAVNTAEGAGQVLSGDVVGGLTNIITSMWEWGQPDREALYQQHLDALEGERERVEKIQSELDFYDLEREKLFDARLDFLKSGKGTFEDWTDTLKSFSDHDLVRGKQVFTDFTAAMNAYNDEVNRARLDLPPLPSSDAYNLYQKGKGIRDNAPDHFYGNDDHLSYEELVGKYGQTEADIVIGERNQGAAATATPTQSTTPSSNEGGDPTRQGSQPPVTATVDTEKIGDVHRFTGGERGQLKTLEGTLKEKRTDFVGLTDADFSTILDGYEAYTRAILDIYNAKMSMVQNSDAIDGQAKETAMTLALQEYHALTFRANRDLESVMGASGLRLVNEFGATTGAIARNQVIKGTVSGDEHRGVVRAEPPPKMKTVTSSSVKAPAETHRFTSAQSGDLRNIEGRARQAAKDFRNLSTQDFSEILTAYGNYTGLLEELYDARVGFINAAHITEGAKQTALEAALIAFQNDTYAANETLARVMKNADLQLVNKFDSTTGIIARNQVIKGTVSGDEHRGVVRAEPPPKMKTVTSSSVKAPAETHRFTSAQSGDLRNIEGRARQAREVLNQSKGQDFGSIVEAYDRYVGLLSDLYAARVAFIEGANLTPQAKKIALEAAEIAFQNDTFSANQLLSRVLATSDLTLTNEIAPTTGVLKTIGVDFDAAVGGTPPETQTSTRTRTPGASQAPTLDTAEEVSALQKMAGLNVDRVDIWAKRVVIKTDGSGANGRGAFGGTAEERKATLKDEMASMGAEGGYASDLSLEEAAAIDKAYRERRTWGDVWAETPGAREAFYANFNTTKQRSIKEPLQAFREQTFSGDTRFGDLATQDVIGMAFGGEGIQDSNQAKLAVDALDRVRNDNDPTNDYLIPQLLQLIRILTEKLENIPHTGIENLLAREGINLDLSLYLDSEQMVTPRFTEVVSDQMELNGLNGIHRR